MSRQFWSASLCVSPPAHRLLLSTPGLSRSHACLAGALLEDEAERVAQRDALAQHLHRNSGHKTRAAQASRQVSARTKSGGGVPPTRPRVGPADACGGTQGSCARPGAGAPCPAQTCVARPRGAHTYVFRAAEGDGVTEVQDAAPQVRQLHGVHLWGPGGHTTRGRLSRVGSGHVARRWDARRYMCLARRVPGARRRPLGGGRGTHVGAIRVGLVHQRVLLAVERDGAVEAGQQQWDAAALEDHVVAGVPANRHGRQAQPRAWGCLQERPQQDLRHQLRVHQLADTAQHGADWRSAACVPAWRRRAFLPLPGVSGTHGAAHM